MCTAISMAIASIAVQDWPEDWPDLLPYLLKLINDQKNRNGGKYCVPVPFGLCSCGCNDFLNILKFVSLFCEHILIF